MATDPRILKNVISEEMTDSPDDKTSLDVEKDLGIPDPQSSTTDHEEDLAIPPSKNPARGRGDEPNDSGR